MLNKINDAHISSFQNVSDSFLTALCEYAELEYALAGDILMYQGDVGDAMYIIKQGLVDVVVDDVAIAKLGSGDVIGEYCVLKEDEKRSATIRAKGDVTVYRLMRDDFQKVSNAFPRDIDEIMKFSKSRLKDNSKSVDEKRRASLEVKKSNWKVIGKDGAISEDMKKLVEIDNQLSLEEEEVSILFIFSFSEKHKATYTTCTWQMHHTGK